MKKLYKIIYYFWLISFVIIPLLSIIINSFFDINNKFTFDNYLTIFTPLYLKMAFTSIFYATIITIICLIFAYPLAYILTKMKKGKIILFLFLIPTWINLLLKTYAFLGILGKDGLINKILSNFDINISLLFNPIGFLIVSIYIFLPFTIIPIYNSFTSINQNLIWAAKDLGASRIALIKKIYLPLTKDGIYSAFQIVFIPTLSIFMITRLIAGNRIITIGTAVEQHFLVTGNWGIGSAIGTILIIILIISIVILNSGDKKNKDHNIINGGTNA